MRVGTLEDAETIKFLSKHFVLVTHNQLPELYCTSGTVDTSKPYPKEQIERATEGAGGGNIRSYFCTPDGKVVNYVSGRWKPRRFLEEARWSLEMLDGKLTKENLRKQQWHKSAFYESQRDQFASPEEVKQLLKTIAATRGSTDEASKVRMAKFQKIAAFNRLIRSHEEAKLIVLQSIQAVLQKVEDEVYTKGSIGCDS